MTPGEQARAIARAICVEYRLSPERYEASGGEHPLIPVIVRHVAPALAELDAARLAAVGELDAYILAEGARAGALQAVLEPFADIDGEGDEDFPDDTPVTIQFGRTTHYAIKLGDFRRARAALTKLDQQER